MNIATQAVYRPFLQIVTDHELSRKPCRRVFNTTTLVTSSGSLKRTLGTKAFDLLERVAGIKGVSLVQFSGKTGINIIAEEDADYKTIGEEVEACIRRIYENESALA